MKAKSSSAASAAAAKGKNSCTCTNTPSQCTLLTRPLNTPSYPDPHNTPYQIRPKVHLNQALLTPPLDTPPNTTVPIPLSFPPPFLGKGRRYAEAVLKLDQITAVVTAEVYAMGPMFPRLVILKHSIYICSYSILISLIVCH